MKNPTASSDVFDTLSLVDKQLLSQLQEGVPLVSRPWAVYAECLQVSQEDVIARVRFLKEQGIIRQISGIFDSRALGYESTLVAAQVAPEQLLAAADAINQHPGVSHNYERENTFNLWYTVTVPPNSSLGLKATVERLHELSGAMSTRLLPTLHLFKIGVRISMGKGDEGAKNAGYTEKDAAVAQANPLQEGDEQAILMLQQDLPLVPQPFASWAASAGMSEARLLAIATRLEKNRQMRRFAAVLHHRKAGAKANAMGVWHVPEQDVVAFGERFAQFDEISHCYHRPSYPDWPYQLFTMVHAPTREQALALLDRMATQVGIDADHRGALFSTREFKKVRVKYFTPDILQWEQSHAAKSLI